MFALHVMSPHRHQPSRPQEVIGESCFRILHTVGNVVNKGLRREEQQKN